MRRLRLLVPVLALAAGCGSHSTHDELPPLAWTWIATAGSECSDGTQTGIGVNPGPGASPNLLVFLNGGGACWDDITCNQLHIATPGPYGSAEFDRDIRALPVGTIVDRTVATNPYKDYTFVFVPYCTGDVHSGDNVPGYGWHHKGRVNVQKALDYLAVKLPAPAKLVISGSSGGGFGSLYAFDRASGKWPSAKAYLVDDSGPPLSNIPTLELVAWSVSWDLPGALSPICGPLDCLTDLSNVIPKLSSKYPTARMALLSSTQDATIRGFFLNMTASEFETGLRDLAAKIEDATDPGQTHAFLVTGNSHTMLGNPAAFASNGVGLFEWLRRQVDDDASWTAAIPP